MIVKSIAYIVKKITEHQGKHNGECIVIFVILISIRLLYQWRVFDIGRLFYIVFLSSTLSYQMSF